MIITVSIGALVFLCLLLFYCHSRMQKKAMDDLLVEAEFKLKKSLFKIEEQSSSFSKECQTIR